MPARLPFLVMRDGANSAESWVIDEPGPVGPRVTPIGPPPTSSSTVPSAAE